jgi:FKBP-type peptidyl-prolyl cis-trans isomerase FkpA
MIMPYRAGAPRHARFVRPAGCPASGRRPVRQLAGRRARLAAPALSTAILPVPLMPVISAGQRQCSTKTASGLGTLTLKAATAVHPGKGDYVLVNYIGYLAADGRVFDQNSAAAFPVEGVIPAFPKACN